MIDHSPQAVYPIHLHGGDNMGVKISRFLLVGLLILIIADTLAAQVSPVKPKQTVVTDKQPAATQVTVPNVVGMSRGDAEAAIEKAGLKVINVVERETKYPDGQVLVQKPEADSKVAKGSGVGIAVSKFKAPEQTVVTDKQPAATQVTVPNVVGMSRGDAEAAIGKAGLKVINVVERETQLPDGQVLGQKPAPDSKVAKGSGIGIAVSKFKAPEQSKAPVVPSGTAPALKTTVPAGKKEAVFPAVEGKPATEAFPELRKLGFSQIAPKVVRSSKPAKTVVGAEVNGAPAETGKSYPVDAAITLSVSSGIPESEGRTQETKPPADPARTVPKTPSTAGGVQMKSEWLGGQGRTVAQALRASGLAVNAQMVASDKPRGTVINISAGDRQLAAGDMLDKGGTVTLAISNGAGSAQLPGDKKTIDLPGTEKTVLPSNLTINTSALVMTGMRASSQTINTSSLIMTGMRISPQTINTPALVMTGMRMPSITITTSALIMTGMRE